MNVLSMFKDIRVFVLDIDGVLTDGSLYITESGDLLRSMNVKDGYALYQTIKKGYRIVIISGGKSESSKIRLEKLGITDVYLGVEDKKVLLEELIQQNNWKKEELLYMGDDIPDIAPMSLCALPVCPNDAAPEVKESSKYISPVVGGRGCVRDVIEKVLKLNNDWG